MGLDLTADPVRRLSVESARDVIGDIVARHAAEKLRLRVADGGEMFYDSASGPIEANELGTRTALEIGGRRWDPHFSAPLQAFRTASDALMPWLPPARRPRPTRRRP